MSELFNLRKDYSGLVGEYCKPKKPASKKPSKKKYFKPTRGGNKYPDKNKFNQLRPGQ